MKTLLAILMTLLPVFAHAQAMGSVPSNMPQSLSVGLFEDTGRTWMKNSGTKWNLRYRYLTQGWSNNWGYGPRDGAFAGQFFKETDTQGFMPAVSYYIMFDLPPSNTGFYAKTKNVASMKEYFEDFKLLMQQAKTFGKPVLVLLEPDGYAYLQGEAQTPNVYSAIKDTGLPELAGLPNTAAGWGLAFLQMRKAVGANNVILGMHISGWATGADLFHFSTNLPLQPAVDSVYDFLSPLGLTANVTGATYDVLVGDPLDRDADFYRLDRNEDRWWDASDTASLTSKSFNRYSEWLRLWNLKSGKRWVLWQIPLGTKNSPNACSLGYKDNRTEYFFGSSGDAHRRKFVNNGVVSLLFGAGADCQATQETDSNYIRDNAKAYLASSGIPLNGVIVDAGSPVVDSGTPVVDAGVPPKPDAGVPVVDAGSPPPSDSAQYSFETGIQGWHTGGQVISGISPSTAKPFAGQKSLAIQFSNLKSGTQQILVDNASAPAGAVISFRVWFPSGSQLGSIQFFAQESVSTGWRWNGNWKDITQLTANAWNTVTIALPNDASAIQSLGIELTVKKPWNGLVFLDSVSWGSVVVVPTDAGMPSVPDAGQPTVDAGVPPKPDAGKPDSGTPVVDAGIPPITGQIKVMPLGDSITAEEWAWRCALQNTITTNGYSTVFVGSVSNQYDPCSPRHEGHPGWTADDLISSMTPWLNTYKPDVITVLYGTNSVAWWTAETGTAIADRANAGLTKMQQLLPGVRLVVMTLPPQSSSIIAPNNVDRQVLVKQFNDRLKILVAARVAAGERVRLADVNAVLTVSDTRDGIHPTTSAGINKMTPVIWEAMKQLL